MYACKRRQRNFRRIRESTRPNQPTNPSKRHRERLNGELETVASLLPYDDATIQKLDKLSVLRLAVSFVQIKAHFALYLRQQQSNGGEPPQLASLAAPDAMFTALSAFSIPISPIPTIWNPQGIAAYDVHEAGFSQLALKSIGGFVVILSEWGDIYYVSENIDQYLGFCQSDVLHQPITDLLHSEDREVVLKALKVQMPKAKSLIATESANGKIEYDTMERVVMGRFRCLLDNTCGFVRMEIRGRFCHLNALASPSEDSVAAKDKSKLMQAPYGLVAICTPFVSPAHLEQSNEDPILKTKHGLDLSFLCIDARLKQILEIEDSVKSGGLSFYQFIHPDDVKCLAECHEETRKNGSSALLVLRVISTKTHTIYCFQSSFRLFYKSGKAESIGITHRYLTEVDGASLLEKRGTVKGSIFTHDEPSLQSPRTLSTAQNLPPLMPKTEEDVKTVEAVSKPRKTPSEKSTSVSVAVPETKKPANSKKRSHNYLSNPMPSSTLGAISCLEELVKASTSNLYPAAKGSKPTKKNSTSKAPTSQPEAYLPREQEHLPALSAVFPQYLHPPAEFHHQHSGQGYATSWPMVDPSTTQSFDFSAYYHPHMHGHPHPSEYSFQTWFPDTSNATFFSEQINGYYAAAHQHLYPEPKSHLPATAPGPPPQFPLPTMLFHEQGPPTQEDFINPKFSLPALNTFQAGKHDAIETTNNFSFLNEVAHTLFGQ